MFCCVDQYSAIFGGCLLLWQMNCISKYCWFAAALNRTLLLPRYGSHGGVERGDYRWRWDVILDVDNMRSCLADSGPSRVPRVVTVDELLKIPSNETHTVEGVDCKDNEKLRGFNCSAPWPDRGCVQLEKVFAPCKNSIAYIDKNHAMSSLCPFNGSQVVLGPTPGLTWDVLEEIRKMSQNMSVISMGSIFYEEVKGVPGKGFFRGKGPNSGPFKLSNGCSFLWSPTPAVTRLARWAIELCTKGQPFASVHLRRCVASLSCLPAALPTAEDWCSFACASLLCHHARSSLTVPHSPSLTVPHSLFPAHCSSLPVPRMLFPFTCASFWCTAESHRTDRPVPVPGGFPSSYEPAAWPDHFCHSVALLLCDL